MKLGEQIKATRAAQGVTQKSLAEASGLTERTIQRIENHEVEPSAHSLRMNKSCSRGKLPHGKKETAKTSATPP